MRRLLGDHVCRNAQQCGWGGIENGELLQQAEGQFDLFVTSDQNLRYQQNLRGRKMAILELSTNKLRRIEAAAPLLRAAVQEMQAGDYRQLEIP